MDEAWERAVEAARGGEDPASVRSLTLDGALKCSQGRLPSPSLLEQFSQLRVLSIANVGLASLADFPSLRYLERLILSDNRIAGGLEHLVEAGLKSLRDIDLSNNKIQLVQDLAPLAHLNILSIDLYECPITHLPDYRSKVFGMVNSLQYLDKLDAENNERPESDDEEEEDEEDVEDELADGIEAEGEEDDVGKFRAKIINSAGLEEEDEVEEDDDKEDNGEESDELDEDDEVPEPYQELGKANHTNHANEENGSDEEGVDDDEDDAVNIEVQDIEETEEEEEEVGDDDEVGGGEEEEEEGTEQGSGPFASTEGEIDAQENEEDGEDENGELGDEEEDVDEGVDNDEEEEDEEEDYGTEYLVQPIGRAEDEEVASDFEPVEDDEDDDEDIADEDDQDDEPAPSLKRKRSKDEGDDSDKDERPPKH